MVSNGKELYDKITGQKRTLLLGLAVVIVIAFLADICIGPAWLSITEIFSAIFQPDSVDRGVQVIVRDIRLPIALMAVMVGASLAIAGAEMQTILDNPLASPFTLGISSAAGFGAALALVFGAGISIGEEFVVPINAFLFAVLTCFLIYSISKVGRFGVGAIVLAGIAVSLFFQSALATVEYYAAEEELEAVVFWMFGNLTRVTWLKLGIVTVVLAVTTPLLVKDAWKLTALRLGEEKARSLGIDVVRLRLKVFICVSVITAVAVCFTGIIGFIGLVGPHIARMLVGEDQRFFLPTSALAGAIFLAAASIASKLVDPGAIFPIGVLTSLIGLPFFIFLLIRTGRQYW
ncbi:MAG: iron ABC transporter permease [Chloroflexota bacterium]|nr:iron ABC transporter permease [Chloroflexota bacterium]